jgi:hypothetical protein
LTVGEAEEDVEEDDEGGEQMVLWMVLTVMTAREGCCWK